jgi:hypothetical protein
MEINDIKIEFIFYFRILRHNNAIFFIGMFVILIRLWLQKRISFDLLILYLSSTLKVMASGFHKLASNSTAFTLYQPRYNIPKRTFMGSLFGRGEGENPIQPTHLIQFSVFMSSYSRKRNTNVHKH